MPKKVLVFAILLVALITGSMWYLAGSSTDKTSMEDMRNQKVQMQESNEAEASTITEQPVTNPGKYIDYTSTAITSNPGTKILFFHAPWCPQCRALESDIQKNGVPGNITIIKVDYDTNQALRQKYGVTLQTTLVRVDDQGGSVKKLVAYDNPSLESVKEVVQ